MVRSWKTLTREWTPRFLAGVEELVLPFECLACGACDPRAFPGLCSGCTLEIPWQAGGWGTVRDGDFRLSVFVATHYTEIVAQLIYQLKYGGNAAAAVPLAAMLADFMQEERMAHRFDALVPIPMHFLKRFGRDFDHGRQLGERLSLHPGMPPVRYGVLRRVRPTVALGQARDHAERRCILAGAFRASPKRLSRGSRIALVDDIVTSGSTGLEAARALYRAGAGRVTLLAVATPGSGAVKFTRSPRSGSRP